MRRTGTEKRIAWLGVLLGPGLLAGCGEPAPTPGRIEVRDAWVRAVTAAVEGTANTAAYMQIINGSRSADRLLGVRSDVARMVELHRTTIDEAGLASMAPVGIVEIPAGDSVLLEPGGLHVMLMGVHGTLEAGEGVRLILQFEAVGELVVGATVRRF